VRFGDPETQAILIRLESDLLEIFQAIAARRLHGVNVRWSDGASACVVLASEGYPGSYETGRAILGMENVCSSDDLQVFHAGTTRTENREFLTAGGRVLGVTAKSATLEGQLGNGKAP